MEKIKKKYKKSLFILAKALRKYNPCKNIYRFLDYLVDIARNSYYAEENKSISYSSYYPEKRQLFFDVTTLSVMDNKTGIQRVVRAILEEFIKQPPANFEIQPVVARYGRYHYAQGSLINYRQGDIFLSIDLNYEAAYSCEVFYQKMRLSGVKVFFVVHDILCITMPHYFFKFSAEKHSRWLNIVSQSDGAICVSQTIAAEVACWIKKFMPQYQDSCRVQWFHLGADIQSSAPSKGLPGNANQILEKLKNLHSFLMVSTVEPRKGHQQVLHAFDLLWKNNISVNLVVVGKQGWKVEKLAKAMRQHSQKDNRLFWLEGVSDEFLEKIYQACDCLIAASEGEGFGLPLIEAARHGLPIIARDIPIFHEVTQNHAFFFQGKDPKILAEAIVCWLELFQRHEHPASENMTYLTWRRSAQQLLDCVLF